MFKLTTRPGKRWLALTIAAVILLAALPLSAEAADSPEWRQLYFDNIRSTADYVSKYDITRSMPNNWENGSPRLIGGNIKDVALSDLNFDGVPELLYSQNIPAGAGFNRCHILSIQNGTVVDVATFTTGYQFNSGQAIDDPLFPNLSATANGDKAYTFKSIVQDEEWMDPEDVYHIINGKSVFDFDLPRSSTVTASVYNTYKPDNTYKQARIGRSMQGAVFVGVPGDVYADAEIWALLDSYVPEVTPVSVGITATPTNTMFMLNDAEVSLPAYLIDGSNYVKLRDVGQLLETRFDVRWEDNKARLYNQEKYTSVGGELDPVAKGAQTATPSNTDFVWGTSGETVEGLTAYLIDGNNYIQLRSIGQLFDFNVAWRDNKAWIEPDKPYTGD